MNGNAQLIEKSYKTLELDRVLMMLSEQAVSDAAKEASMALRPDADINQVRMRMMQTSAARTLIGRHGTPVFSGVKSVGDSLGRAQRGGFLNTRELLTIAGLLGAALAVKSYMADEGGEKTCLNPLFASIKTNKYLSERITTAILSEEEIADIASAELASIRRKIRSANSRIRDTLQKIITSQHYARFLQEAIITQRSDRYVVPVKAEYRSSVGGLVHDISASGATLFIEPMQVVTLNNELKELQAKEKKEIERILAELSAEVADHAEDIGQDYTILVELDVIFARGRLSYALDASEPELQSGRKVILRNARHPLLDKNTAVPIGVRLGDDFDTLVITGPNTGGKTVALKTIGLLTLMAQCGLHIPADYGSSISVFEAVLADIGDEQSIEQSLSTFSSHMTNIVSILGRADEGALVLLDELGAGTDPVEGAALAISIIEFLRGAGAKVAATTHYAELKMFAMTTQGVENASCEFDVETLRPTYRLLIGVPGRSNAFAISTRLGLPEYVVEHARRLISSEDKHFEDVIAQLESKRQAMEQELTAARQDRLQTARERKTAEQYRKETERARSGATERARAEARQIVEEAKKAADEALHEFNERIRRQEKSADWRQINDMRSKIRYDLNRADEKIGGGDALPEEPELQRPVKPGDTVRILGMNVKATVLTPADKDGNVSLQAGIMKVEAKQNELRLAEPEKPVKKAQTAVNTISGAKAAPAVMEVDLRGMMADEALLELDRFLDHAMMLKMTGASIIHGKGTGALRAAVQQHLKNNKYIKEYRLGRYGEGEDGVTLVEFK